MPIQKPQLSQKEKERRYTLLRAKLKKEGLSALIIYGGTQLGVSVHYLTQVWGTKMNAVLFPAEGDPLFIYPSNTVINEKVLNQQGCWIPEENILLAANTTEEIAKQIIRLKLQKTKIGIDSFRFWPVFEYQALMDKCPGIRLVEAHRLYGEIRGSKSAEELAVMEKARHVSDLSHYTFLANLKPGCTEMEVAGKANAILDEHGVIDRIILIHTNPAIVYPGKPGPSLITKPNPVIFSPEFTRTLGYGAQMIRTYCWEEPKGEYKRMFNMWADMRKLVLKEFRPGVEITDAARKIEALVDDYGFECDKLGHAVGIAYGDAPYITAGPHQKDFMEWTILPNEVYAVHPMVRGKNGKPPFSMIGDMYLVGKDKTQWLTQAMPELPVMIP
jgi:Xaa-Pro aminopeptidase